MKNWPQEMQLRVSSDCRESQWRHELFEKMHVWAEWDTGRGGGEETPWKNLCLVCMLFNVKHLNHARPKGRCCLHAAHMHTCSVMLLSRSFPKQNLSQQEPRLPLYRQSGALCRERATFVPHPQCPAQARQALINSLDNSLVLLQSSWACKAGQEIL